MRLLCIDLGDKRTGVAAGDTITKMAGPVGILEIGIKDDNGAALVRAVGHAIGTHAAQTVVFGLPLNMDGTEGPRAKLVRAFAARLAGVVPGIMIAFEDERLSSVRADWKMAKSGLTRGQKKSRRDALAATGILQDHLDNLPETPPAKRSSKARA